MDTIETTDAAATAVLKERLGELKDAVGRMRGRERDLWNEIAAAAVRSEDTTALRAERHQLRENLEDHYAAIERLQLATRERAQPVREGSPCR